MRSRVSNAMDPVPLPSGGEPRPQVDFAGHPVRRQLGGRAGPEDAPLMNDIGPVYNLQGFSYVVIRDEDSDPPVLELPDDALDVIDRDGVDAGEWLVQTHEG